MEIFSKRLVRGWGIHTVGDEFIDALRLVVFVVNYFVHISEVYFGYILKIAFKY